MDVSPVSPTKLGLCAENPHTKTEHIREMMDALDERERKEIAARWADRYVITPKHQERAS